MVIIALLLRGCASGTISFDPAPIEDRFAQAPIVARGVVESVKGPGGAPERNGKLIPVPYTATVSLEAQYKGGPLPDRFLIFFPSVDQMSGPPLRLGSRCIFFLEPEKDQSSFQLIAAPGAIIYLNKLLPPKTDQGSGAGGPEGLQADVVAGAEGDDRVFAALGILTQFRRLRPETLKRIQAIQTGDSDIRMLKLLLLTRSNHSDYFSYFAQALEQWSAAYPTVVMTPTSEIIMKAAVPILREPQSSKDLQALETSLQFRTHICAKVLWTASAS